MSKGGRWDDERACGHSCVSDFSQDVFTSEVVCVCLCVIVTAACVRQPVNAGPSCGVCSSRAPCGATPESHRRGVTDPTANVARSSQGDRCAGTSSLMSGSLFIKPY